MKKILLIGMLMFSALNISYAAKTKQDTEFTFRNYEEKTVEKVRITERKQNLEGSKIQYPYYTGLGEIAQKMNKTVSNFVKDYKGSKNKTYEVTYKTTVNNQFFVSGLYTIVENDKKAGTTKTYYNGLTFNIKSGKAMLMKDIFVDNYSNALSGAVSDKMKQFGVETVNDFSGLTKKQRFYLEDDAIVLIFNQNEGTDFADGHMFIPFMFRDLIGIIK